MSNLVTWDRLQLSFKTIYDLVSLLLLLFCFPFKTACDSSWSYPVELIVICGCWLLPTQVGITSGNKSSTLKVQVNWPYTKKELTQVNTTEKYQKCIPCADAVFKKMMNKTSKSEIV